MISFIDELFFVLTSAAVTGGVIGLLVGLKYIKNTKQEEEK